MEPAVALALWEKPVITPAAGTAYVGAAAVAYWTHVEPAGPHGAGLPVWPTTTATAARSSGVAAAPFASIPTVRVVPTIVTMNLARMSLLDR